MTDNSKIAPLIQKLVGSAYHCGHLDAPSFCCPAADKVFGYKELMAALDQKDDERSECLKLVEGGYKLLNDTRKMIDKAKITHLNELIGEAEKALNSARHGLACMSEYIAMFKNSSFSFKDSVRETEKLVEEAHDKLRRELESK